jgi:hypothetical protein
MPKAAAGLFFTIAVSNRSSPCARRIADERIQILNKDRVLEPSSIRLGTALAVQIL